MEKLIIGSRGSKLALKYAEIAKKAFLKELDIEIEIKKITTEGDLILDRRTSEIGGKGEFIKNIEKELISKNIDIAVHSLKDVPSIKTKGLKMECFLKRNDPQEVLINKENLTLNKIKKNSVIGTSSLRREFQLKHLRPDLKFKLIRGNIDTRIKKLDEDKYDSIILAKAGLVSLSIENRISEVFECKKIVPPAGQGTIVLQSRDDDDKINSILSKINHFETSIEAKVERKILSVLEGDCNTAAGIYANIKGKNVDIMAELFSDNGDKKFTYKDECKIEEALKIAEKAGNDLKKQFEMAK
ncbi:hydroxymethylbilane synthase [Candidatus Pelagibacter sp.]|nr:hydroxymethylbilane synthase [Candidatus Pelagibacter sp.]